MERRFQFGGSQRNAPLCPFRFGRFDLDAPVWQIAIAGVRCT